MSFAEFGEIVETPIDSSSSPEGFMEFGEVVETPLKSSSPARMAKGAAKGLGTYGDILDLFGLQTKEQLLPGHKALVEAESKAPESLLPFLQDDDIIPRFSRLASSEEIGTGIEKLGGPAKAESFREMIEERGPEFLTSLLTLGGAAPGKNLATRGIKTLTRALLPASVSVAGEKADLPPWAQAASTIASSLLAHRLTGKSLSQLNSETYKKAYEAVPEGAYMSAAPLVDKIHDLRDLMLKGGKAPSEKAVLDFTKEALKKMRNGTVQIDELTALKRSLNEIVGLNELRKAPRARNLLKGLSKDFGKQIDKYGKTNPEFYKHYKAAQSAHKGLNEASFIENFVKKHPLLGTEAGIVLKYLIPGLSVKGVLGGGAAVKSAQIVSALSRNSGLRKLYFKFLKDASRGNLKPAIHSLKAFNKKAKKELGEEFEEDFQ